MAHAGPLSSEEVAKRSGTAERYVRDWLRNQTAGGDVRYDAQTDRYTTSPTHALALADEASPLYILRAYETIASLYADEERFLEAFRGTWMIVEPFAHDRVQDNLNPIGRMFLRRLDHD